MADQIAAPQQQNRVIMVQRLLIKYSLPLCFFFAIVLALGWPVPGDVVHSCKVKDFSVLSTFNIFVIFFVNGLILRLSEVKGVFSIYFILIFLYSMATILFITPLTGLVVLNTPNLPVEFKIGFVLWCAAPTPGTSSVALTNAVNGNYVLALLLNITTNGLGIVTVPFFLNLVLEKFVRSIEINAMQLLIKLLCVVLLPFLVAIFLQCLSPKIREFGQKNKTILSIAVNVNAGLAVWQVVSKSQERIIQTKFSSVFMMLGIGILIHVVFLLANYTVSKIFRLEEKEKRAVLIVASSKSILIPLTVISYFEGDESIQGLFTVPVILSYIVQLFIDRLIVS
eukprot:TRINITY_DN5453_c0_g1_i6.p1 TRINITY_DN5453_c0_g1~~TRINITY_DN5453_c0_g1_i6.p1  ORF type:complete len:339 (+),score=20.08 TRINITY_DN5453_c0_g1_i6:138-1154(+)